MGDKAWNAYENRCDNCGAESWFKFERLVVVESTGTAADGYVQDFFFCGHHGRKYEADLTLQGWEVADHTDQINIEASVSANAEPV